ncbi:terminase TerL endonuclease subunit [Streptosporangium canum]|uniref:terminase TerL endonuclease subunit n=1 Tax=Streptosporangium canum TaxID=324952 RepID=UPI003446EDFD
MAATTASKRKTRASASSKGRPKAEPPCQGCGWRPAAGELWPSHGGIACRWIEDNLVFAEGDYFGRPFRLREDQRRFLFRWYEFCPACWADRSRPPRWRYRRALRGAAKGDGKTAFIAAIGCLEFAGPPCIATISPNVPIMAASFEQADLLFSAAATMLGGKDNQVTEAPLCGLFEVYDTEIKFADGRPGRLYRVAAVGGTNDGSLPTTLIADELHELGEVGSRKARAHLVISNGLRKRQHGREINLSTAGFDVDASLLGEMYKHGRRVLLDASIDPEFLFDWQEAPDGLNYDLPADREIAVRAASQAAGALWDVADRVRRYNEPGVLKHEWIRYYANRWVEVAEDSWLKDHPQAWNVCQGDATIPDKVEVVVAVDMALKRDSVAVLTAWKNPEGRIAVQVKIWQPHGGRIDHLQVVDYIRRDLADQYTINEITYDPRFFEVPARLLEDEGFNLVEFPQSIERMTPACGQALEAILEGLVVHDGDPDLASHVTSAVMRPNERGFTLSKGKSKRKIDACIALVIALWRILAPDPEEEQSAEPWAAWV